MIICPQSLHQGPNVVERPVEVVAVDGEGVTLRALAACSDCTGCGGRCDLIRLAPGSDVLCLPRALFPHAPRSGERWRIALGEDELLQQSLRGYGSALVGLVAGAAAGHFGALAIDIAPDLPAAAAAFSGTILAILLSKRGHAAGLHLLEASDRP